MTRFPDEPDTPQDITVAHHERLLERYRKQLTTAEIRLERYAGQTYVHRRGCRWGQALMVLGAVTAVASIVCWFVGIWTVDFHLQHRFFGTATLSTLLTVVFFVVGGALYAQFHERCPKVVTS